MLPRLCSPVREESPAAKEHVRLPACDSLEPLEERGVDLLRAKVVDEVIVVNSNLENKKEVLYKHYSHNQQTPVSAAPARPRPLLRTTTEQCDEARRPQFWVVRGKWGLVTDLFALDEPALNIPRGDYLRGSALGRSLLGSERDRASLGTLTVRDERDQ